MNVNNTQCVDSSTDDDNIEEITISHDMLAQFECGDDDAYADDEEEEIIDPEPIDPSFVKTHSDISCGKIHSFVERSLVIEADSKTILDIGSVVCTEDCSPIGTISDVFGPVKQPFYSVNISSKQLNSSFVSLNTSNLTAGVLVYYIPSLSSLVLPSQLATKATDDESDEFYSDDETEEKAAVSKPISKPRQPARRKFVNQPTMQQQQLILQQQQQQLNMQQQQLYMQQQQLYSQYPQLYYQQYQQYQGAHQQHDVHQTQQQAHQYGQQISPEQQAAYQYAYSQQHSQQK